MENAYMLDSIYMQTLDLLGGTRGKKDPSAKGVTSTKIGLLRQPGSTLALPRDGAMPLASLRYSLVFCSGGHGLRPGNEGSEDFLLASMMRDRRASQTR